MAPTGGDHRRPTWPRVGRVIAAGAMAFALGGTLGACGGSSNDNNQTTAVSAGAVKIGQSDSGFPGADTSDKAATGKPLTFAYISLEGSPQIAFPQQREGAQAAIEYVNTKLGGIAGRPIKLVTCNTDATPAKSAACANQLLQHHPVAFFGSTDINSFTSFPLIENAKVPVLGGLAVGGPESNSPISFQFLGGTPILWTGLGYYAANDLEAKSVAVPVASGAAAAASKISHDQIVAGAKAGGARVFPTATLDPAAADVSPFMSALIAKKPDAIVAANTTTQCVALAQARQSLGYQGKFLYPAGCADPRQLQQMGSAANGIYFVNQIQAPGDDGPDVQLYKAWMTKVSPKTPLDEFTSSGFQAVMNSWTVLSRLKADEITSPQIIKAMKAAKDVPSFMATTFTCDGAIKGYISICNPRVMISQVGDDGRLKPVKDWFDPSAYAPPPATAP